MQQWHLEEARSHQSELLQQARQHKLYRAALAGRQRSPRPRPRALIWFGGQLIVWGNRLQGCCDALGTSGAEQLRSVTR
ncbi:MAG TPA: hypothetical protein VH540_28815 [Ktedonobacterales bacterium]|jgi:hypothetical protein